MIEGGNFIDLRKEALVDLLNIRSGQRTGLSVGKERREGRNAEQETGQDEPCQFHMSLKG
jgi:hypothetical protein